MGKIREPKEPNLNGSSSHYDFPFTAYKTNHVSPFLEEIEPEEYPIPSAEPDSSIYWHVVSFKPGFKQVVETFLCALDFEENEEDEARELASYIFLKKLENRRDFTYFPLTNLLKPIKNLDSISDEFRSVDISLENLLAGNLQEEKKSLGSSNLKNEKYFADMALYISSINDTNTYHLWLTLAYMEKIFDKLYLLVSHHFEKEELRLCNSAFSLKSRTENTRD